MRKHLLLIFALLCMIAQGAWAQTNFGNVPETVSATDATIMKMGHLTMTIEKEVVIDLVGKTGLGVFLPQKNKKRRS